MKNMKQLFAMTLALVMLLCICLTGCKETKKIVDVSKMTPEEHYRYIEGESLDAMADSVTEYYGKYIGYFNSMGSHSEVTLSVEQAGMDMLEELMMGGSGDLDMSWLSSVKITTDSQFSDNTNQVKMAIALGNTDILSCNVITNLAKGVFYLALPELSDQALKMEIGEYALEQMQGLEMLQNLPSEEVVGRIIDRYMDILLENIDEVTRSEQEVTQAGVSQDCYVLKVRIYEEDAIRIAKAVLTQARDDADIKAVIEAMGDQFFPGGYTQLQESIDEALAFMEEYEIEDSEQYISLTTYTDKKNNVIGRRVAMPDNQGEVSYLTVTDGDGFTYKMDLAGKVSMTGSGTVKDGKTNGTYSVSVMGMEIAALEVQNFQSSEKSMTGTVSIKPSSVIMENTMEWLQGVSLEVDLDISNAASKIDMRVLLNGTKYLTVSAVSQSTVAGTVTEPDNYVDMTDSDELQQWVSGMDYQELMERIEDAGGEGIIQLIELLMKASSQVKPAV